MGHMKVLYSDAFVAAGEDFDTTRKAAWVAESLRARPVPGADLVEPAPLDAEQLETVHAPDYVRAVRTGDPRSLAESNGLGWDAGLWTAVCASNGGVVEAALHALQTGSNAGALSSGLHHARRSSGGGFCTFNGIALAVHAVTAQPGEQPKRVLILDLDAHCGGGTYSLVREIPGVVQTDISVCRTDFYQTDSRQPIDARRHRPGGGLPAGAQHTAPGVGGGTVRPGHLQRRYGPARGFRDWRARRDHQLGDRRTRARGVRMGATTPRRRRVHAGWRLHGWTPRPGATRAAAPVDHWRGRGDPGRQRGVHDAVVRYLWGTGLPRRLAERRGPVGWSAGRCAE